ncbi:arabinose ABC transporter substrate-binding protein [Burkholderia ubonensis]|uniref:L-arabinose-binding periplasmic protein n=1 Tax=Burkholderia ubonensis TaxID=101571 RepID=A0A107FY30_9BURK|nr:arabinose ABC transporter substrate-binding protein [Burkholderia ubonensis]AOK58195.1 sugar ABC transporter substrate-binding protein [Burkholderia ubonensis]KWD74091.1 sugar ABC transporter substrate-binding protein [Burkholderia ubonensis]KWD90361.1 sugar ABC transporter substrate-binding protein [Burkholderia ubonensis]KWD93292.1 sugar ABC transporter substrate-binding protein [Burkholderia ubonensis]KWE01805.1 sugar ABC transporter substrate-binding protein [Burkholderia ubonensis]
MKRRSFVTLAAAAAVLMGSPLAHAADPVKIGFLVKQPEEPWFQDEWKFAELAAKDKGFTLVKIGAPSGEKVMSAIDNLAAQKAQGFIICTPDVKLGPGIVAKAKSHGLKMMTVDDRLVDGAGKPLEAVPHMGISAYNIGKQVGDGIAAEIRRRGWNMKEVGAIDITYEQLPTAHDRTSGATDALVAAGFPKANVIAAPQAKTDTENAFNAANIALTKNPQFKHWVAYGLNDEAVLGAVRAAEGRGFKAADMIGIGIGGSDSALNEFKKPQPTGFFGTVIISPKRHGEETSDLMYAWITQGKAPAPLTLTTGMLATRENVGKVRDEMGLASK